MCVQVGHISDNLTTTVIDTFTQLVTRASVEDHERRSSSSCVLLPLGPLDEEGADLVSLPYIPT